jgi:hypothetical protein
MIPVTARSNPWVLLSCWDCGFKCRRRHGWLCLVSDVCCQVEVSTTGRSIVQFSPTKCGVPECDLEALKKGASRPTLVRGGGLSSHEKKMIKIPAKLAYSLKSQLHVSAFYVRYNHAVGESNCKLAQDAAYQSHTGRLTGLWFLPKLVQGWILITKMNKITQYRDSKIQYTTRIK